MIHIEAFTPDDLEEITRVDEVCFGSSEPYPAFFFRQASDVFGELLRVAKTADGRIAGYLLGAINIDTNLAWLLSLCTLPEYRRMGTSTALVHNFAGLLSHRNVTEVFLTVAPDNLAAIIFYNNLRFRREKEIEGYYGPGETRLLMKTSVDDLKNP